MHSTNIESIHGEYRQSSGYLDRISPQRFDLSPDDRRLSRLRSLLFGPPREEGHALRTDHDCFYRTLVEGALDVITVVDESATILFKSPSSERLLGYPPGELIGRNLFEHVHTDDVRRVRTAFEEVVRGEKPSQPVEHRLRHKNGSWRTFESVGSFRRDLPAGPLGIINSRDVTARKLLEMQVRQAQKMEAVGLMTGAIAHDFNNLMVVIAGYADLLGGDPSATVRDFAGEMRRAAERAIELTRQLLTFARPSQVDQLPSCDANEVIADLRGILDRLAGRDVLVTFALDALRAQVSVGRASLDQILINLGVNARDAMPSGGALTVTTRNAVLSRPGAGPPSTAPAEYLVLEVTDSGIGMTDEVKARIFEPFFTTKEPGRGTGLGLQTVFGIVQQANGWIEVISEPERGTTFRVCLPIHSPLSPSV